MMARLLALAILCTSPAMAQEVTMDGLTVTHHNLETSGRPAHEDFRFSLPEGDVVLHLFRQGEACQTRPACPDTLSVTSLPTGWRADPMEVTTPELLRRQITIIPYNGF